MCVKIGLVYRNGACTCRGDRDEVAGAWRSVIVRRWGRRWTCWKHCSRTWRQQKAIIQCRVE